MPKALQTLSVLTENPVRAHEDGSAVKVLMTRGGVWYPHGAGREHSQVKLSFDLLACTVTHTY